MKYFLGLIFIISTTSVIATAGPISGGGGGVVVYQAKAIAQIMLDISQDQNIASKYFSNPNGMHLKSLTWLSWKDGVTVYSLRNSANCEIIVETKADDSGMNYTTNWHEMNCAGQ